jgi:hypothetical protein
MLVDAIHTLQIAILMLAGFTAILWQPVARQIFADAARGRVQIGMTIRLWRLMVGTGGVLAMCLFGFFPQILYSAILRIGITPVTADLSTLLSLIIFYQIIMWFAAIGRAARAALRSNHPHPYDSEDWLRWPYLQYVAILILVSSALMTFADR